MKISIDYYSKHQDIGEKNPIQIFKSEVDLQVKGKN